MTIKRDPIEVAKVRQNIRATRYRLHGLRSISDFVDRTALGLEDKKVIQERVLHMIAGAEEALERAYALENALLNSERKIGQKEDA